jgi:hypothetical protein
MANWERKSSYLLREIVKFRTYIDSLRNAISKKAEIYASTNNYYKAPADGENGGTEEEEAATAPSTASTTAPTTA